MEEQSNVNDVKEENFKNDLKYIEEEVIARQNNGLLCKYSKLLNCITVVNMDEVKYYGYWIDRYKPVAKERRKDIIEDCNRRMNTIRELIDNKLANDLLPLEEMIKLEEDGKEIKKEKEKILEAILDTKKVDRKKASNFEK